jgi:glucosyl-3-phosphoglycerate synthase
MVTVIIPALNEAKTIQEVIRIVKQSNCVREIIVIDDKSTDNTVAIAQQENVKVFTSSVRGKGSSIREGILLAQHDIIAFVDADIVTYPSDVINRLSQPIIDCKADFVKSYFERQAGRVTELVAKPLLSILFPSLSNFKQPLSGMFAGKKELLQKISIEDDYGVDVGILIDMHLKGAIIEEVSLGYIENRMQSIAQLGKMSKEVTQTILKKSGQLIGQTLGVFTGLYSKDNPQMDFASRASKKRLPKMAIFDMDKTILKESFIHTLAGKFSFKEELSLISSTASNTFMRIKQIAQLLKSISVADILQTADEISVIDDVGDVIQSLQHKGYVCGIISESYDVVTHHIANKLGMDFSLANELEFNKSIATGEVKIPSFFLKSKHSICSHDYCKSNAIVELSKRYSIPLQNIIAIGNGKNDICMIKNAGIGIAFCTDNKVLAKSSDYNILTPAFNEMLQFAV